MLRGLFYIIKYHKTIRILSLKEKHIKLKGINIVFETMICILLSK